MAKGPFKMRSVSRIKLMAIFISLLFLLIPGISIAETLPRSSNPYASEFQEIDEPTSAVPNYIPVELNLRENNILSPELPAPGTADSSIVCPNGFTPAWWSIRKRRGSTEWRDVGTWETLKVGKQLQATGPIRFVIWVMYLGAGTPGTSNFEFNWLRNDDIIASTRVEDVDLRDGMEPLKIDAQGNLINQTPFEAGDIFKLLIRCQISLDGARILYGSREHRSHVLMTCDPIDVLQVTACDHGIKGLYSDVFRVKYTEMTFIGKVNQQLVTTQPQFGVESVDTRNFNFVSWEIKLEPATYEVEIGISYVPNDNTSVVSKIEQIKINAKKEPTWFGLPVWLAKTIIGVIVLIIILAIAKVIYNKVQEKRWMKDYEEEQRV